MSSLEVLQIFPAQRTTLFSSIGVVDYASQIIMKFNATDLKPHIPYDVAFQINVSSNNRPFQRIIIDEGDSIYVISLSCWKYIGSLELTPSPTLLMTFDG